MVSIVFKSRWPWVEYRLMSWWFSLCEGPVDEGGPSWPSGKDDGWQRECFLLQWYDWLAMKLGRKGVWRAGHVLKRAQNSEVRASLHVFCAKDASVLIHALGQLECEQDRATCGVNDHSTQVLPFSPKKNHTWRQELDADPPEGAMLCSGSYTSYSISRAMPDWRKESLGFTVGNRETFGKE